MSSLHELASQWFELYALAIVQNSLFLGLVFFALRSLRGAPAQSRYLVAVVGLVKLFTPPFVPLPGVLGRSAPIDPITGAGSDALGFVPAWLVGSAGGPAPGLAVEMGTSWITLVDLLFVAWAIGAAFALLVPVVATLRLLRRLHGATPVFLDPALRSELGSRITVHRSNRIALPLTLGIFPRRIFVPMVWDQWPRAQRRLFLLHERAHLRRADGYVQALQVVARAIFWPHPMVHALLRRLDEWREMACDDACLRPERRSALRYVWFMVEAAESVLRSPSARGAAFDTASRLIRRKHELLVRIDYQMAQLRSSRAAEKLSEKGPAMSSPLRLRTSWILVVLGLLILPLSWTWSTHGAHSLEAIAALQSSPPMPPPPPDHEAVRITLGVGGKMDIAGEATEVGKFGAKLAGLNLGGGNPSQVVLDLHCDSDLPMGELQAYQKLFVAAGYSKVRYVDQAGSGHPLVLPGPDLKEKLAGIPQKHVMLLQLDEAGKVRVDGVENAIEALSDEVKKRLAVDEALVVEIETHARTRYADFLSVLTAAQDAGAQRIAILPPPPSKS